MGVYYERIPVSCIVFYLTFVGYDDKMKKEAKTNGFGEIIRKWKCIAMTSFERIKAMTENKPVDRPAIAAWYHMPMIDHHARDFADGIINSVEFMKWDIAKVQSHSFHVDAAFGNEYIPSTTPDKLFGPITKLSVYHPKMFHDLRVPSVSSPSIARELDVIKRVVDHFKGKVPVLATLFSAAYTARSLCGGFDHPPFFLNAIKYSPEDVHKGLEIVQEYNMRFMEECIKIGVDGIFLAEAFASTDQMDEATHDEFVKKYDLPVLKAIEKDTWFNMLHVHGYKNLRFAEYEKAGYPIQAYNWEDRMPGEGTTSLKEARAFTDKILMGGIEFWHDFDSAENDREAVKRVIKARLEDALAQLGPQENKFIFTPGCSVKMHVPEYRMKLIHEVMEEVTGVS